ncbi:prolyl-tRNA synthetase [bacterium]|nr:prolyl-tRNA synthetase [bacterium]
MKRSELFTKTQKDISKEAVSINHQLLVKAGFIDQLQAGVYTILPLGLRVVKKIEAIVRKKMEEVGGQEIIMPALQPAENWKKTDRWDNLDVLFRFTSFYTKNELALGPTHEEVVTPLAKKFIFSYKDLPRYVFQIQTKFRDEKRAKSGMLRGREFLMKDLYSFHKDEMDLIKYYDKLKIAYMEIYDEIGIGLKTYLTFASGGSFSKFSHEFQTVSESGEDTIYICEKCNVAINDEIIKEQKNCPECSGKDFRKEKAIEVGNIFKLMDKFSNSFNLKYVDEEGKEKPIMMGCYGIGIGRLMGTAVETFHDKDGIIWPKNIAPYSVYLIDLNEPEAAKKVYNDLQKAGIEVLWDDRDVSASEKFKDADLIGLPLRVVISKRTLGDKGVEVKERIEEKGKIVGLKNIVQGIKSML